MTKPSSRIQLPEEWWLKKDDVQFAWLDAAAGGKLDGYTWHHTETPGVMQRVPYGIHRIYSHDGGRAVDMWANAPK